VVREGFIGSEDRMVWEVRGRPGAGAAVDRWWLWLRREGRRQA
jgi:hypothetical protein